MKDATKKRQTSGKVNNSPNDKSHINLSTLRSDKLRSDFDPVSVTPLNFASQATENLSSPSLRSSIDSFPFFIQNVCKEFEHYQLYKEHYDYTMGNPIIQNLITKMNKIERENKNLLNIIVNTSKQSNRKIKRETTGSENVRRSSKLRNPLKRIKKENSKESLVTCEQSDDEVEFCGTRSFTNPSQENIIIIEDDPTEEEVVEEEETTEDAVTEEEEPTEEEVAEEEEPTEDAVAEEEEPTEEEVAEEEEPPEDAVTEEEESPEDAVVEEEEPTEEAAATEEEEEEPTKEEAAATEEEEEEESVYSVMINDKEYYTDNEVNGIIYNEDVSIEVGKFIEGKPHFY
jgi:hypothetical protein